jgi:L-ascorbate metabolism protein UlaG (beta-lactamase superfamily)
MFKDVGAEYLLPVHHSTFRLSREPVGEPLRRLLAAAGAESWRVVAPEVGATWALSEGAQGQVSRGQGQGSRGQGQVSP